jgi:hypothetical protein
MDCVVLGELVQTTAGKSITHPPTRCPNGHTLRPGEVLVGHQACLGHGGGHTTWTCGACDQTVKGAPLNTHARCWTGQRRCGSQPHGTKPKRPARHRSTISAAFWRHTNDVAATINEDKLVIDCYATPKRPANSTRGGLGTFSSAVDSRPLAGPERPASGVPRGVPPSGNPPTAREA